MRYFIAVSILIGAAQCMTAAEVKIGSDRRIAFNQGWAFQKADLPGAETVGFDDSNWRKLDLPHDWAIEGPFDPKHDPRCGGLPFYGVAWYRKRFTLPPAARGRHLSIQFDGAMSNARVWLNGKELGERPYGYISFAFDLTEGVRLDGENVIAVRLAPEDRSSRWYPGAGIYRNVWLDVTGPVRVARWGTYVTTPKVSATEAAVAIQTEIENMNSASQQVTLETSIVDPAGRTVARLENAEPVPAGGSGTFSQNLNVPNPRPWDVDSPVLYQAVSVVRNGAQVLDRYTTPFGIRTLEFDAAKGFLLNGRHLKMKGVCMHHDLGALGAAVNRRATERQLQIMKSMGVNAIRTSHNPPSPELLDYCDRLGLMVMDEAFDMWRIPKVPNGLSKFFDKWGDIDLRDMVRRDRNHPSVVLWSIGNEIPEQGRADGRVLAKRLADIVRANDRTRPVTAGFDQDAAAIKNGLADQVDVPGFNYKPFNYERILRDHPKWIIVGTETASTVSSRGVYHLPLEKYEKHSSLQVSSYDIIAPPWAYAPDPEFQAQDKLPQVLGEFVWTGFDYLGEPTPYGGRSGREDWPSRSSYFGIVDLAGFPKDRYYFYQSVWTTQPMVHILPHWNWQGREGQSIPVMAYSNAEQVELFLNGRSLGRKDRGMEAVEIPVGPNISPTRKFSTKYRLMWQVPYEPGVLQAVAYRSGAKVATQEVRTAGEPARIRLVADRDPVKGNGDDLVFVTVRVEDRNGNFCPLADNLVKFKVEGAGRIAAVDNGNAASVEPFQADHRKAFNGLALLIVRSNGQPGRIRISATSEGLETAETTETASR